VSDLAEKILGSIARVEKAATRALEGRHTWSQAVNLMVYDYPADEDLSACELHALEHAPTIVLRRCAADREIVQDWLDTTKDPYEGWTDDQLHERRAHSCYEYATTEGQRKAWDYSTEPPRNEDGTVSEGWEFNRTEANPEAWERFDYHEERYWRRRVKPGPHVWVRWVPKHIELLARGYGLEVDG
jgi:hypothetical protein